MLVLAVIFILLPVKRSQMDYVVPAAAPSAAFGAGAREIFLQLTEIHEGCPRSLIVIRSGGHRTYEEVVRAADLARSAGVQVVALGLGAPWRDMRQN